MFGAASTALGLGLGAFHRRCRGRTVTLVLDAIACVLMGVCGAFLAFGAGTALSITAGSTQCTGYRTIQAGSLREQPMRQLYPPGCYVFATGGTLSTRSASDLSTRLLVACIFSWLTW